jgi:hypothetical protein
MRNSASARSNRSTLCRYRGAICRDRKLKHIPPVANRHHDSLILSIGRYHRWRYTSPKLRGITRATSYPGKFLKCASRARYALPTSVNATKSFKSNRLLSAISPTFRPGLLRMSPGREAFSIPHADCAGRHNCLCHPGLALSSGSVPPAEAAG